MQKSMKKTWIGLFVLLIIFIALSIVLSSNKTKEYPAFLSTSPSPTGVKGFFTLLEEEVGSVRHWKHDPSLLDKTENQLLVMVEPSLITEQAVMNDYLEYVETGNTLLVFKRNLEGMFDISTEYAIIDSEIITLENRNGAELGASMFSQMRIVPEEEDQVLFQDDLGAIAIKREIGNGSIIAVNSPDWLTNQYILEEDNLELVLELLEDDSWNSILIDEFTHQSKQSQHFTNVYPMGLLVAGFQLIVITLLWLLYKGKRFGPIRIPREDYVRFSDERITALAAWYQKGKAYRESLESQAEYLRFVLREKWGISYQKEWKDLKEQLTPKLKMIKEDELTTFLYDMEAVLQKQNVTKQEFLLWSRRMDRLRKEVEEG